MCIFFFVDTLILYNNAVTQVDTCPSLRRHKENHKQTDASTMNARQMVLRNVMNK